MREGHLAVDLLTWLRLRWSTMVERYLGEDHTPDHAIGVHLTAGVQADYLAKLGLELQDPSAAKASRAGHRSVMRLAADYARTRDPRDAELWRHYADAMRGAKALTWSRGARWLRAQAGIVDRSDQDLAEDEEQIASTDRVVAVVPWSVWQAVRSAHYESETACTWLLAVIERHGANAFSPALDRLMDAVDQAQRNSWNRRRRKRQQ